jgi:hypothetical protein
MVGGDPRPVGRVFDNESLEAYLFGGRGLKAQLEGLQLLVLGKGRCFCHMRSRKRRLQHRDVAVVLAFFLQRHQLACLEFFFERDELCLSALAIGGLRVERLGQPPALGPILVDRYADLQPFNAALGDSIATRALTFVQKIDHGAEDRLLEPLRLRLVAEVKQQRLETVRVVLERSPLNEHAASLVIADDEIALERCGTRVPAPRHEFLPLSAVSRDYAIDQVRAHDAARVDAEEAERATAARDQRSVEAHPDQAGRLPLEELTQIGSVRRWTRRAGCTHIVNTAHVCIHVRGT